MKYVCLVYGDEQQMRTINDAECLDVGNSLRRNGKYVAAEALQPSHSGKTVRVRNGKPMVVDGPYTEAKELVAGFYLIDAADIDEAVELASKIPAARIGGVEVRPVRPLEA
jgi:hypothetical protein